LTSRLIPLSLGMLLLASATSRAEDRLERDAQVNPQASPASESNIIRSPDPGQRRPQFPTGPDQVESAAETAASQTRAEQPDEQHLWTLWDQGRTRTLEQTLRSYRKTHPDWRPPQKLIALLAAKRASQRAQNAGTRRATGEPERAPRLKRPDGQDRLCTDPNAAWSVAETHGQRAEHGKALAIYTRMLTHCPWPVARATLQKAAVVSDDAGFQRLTALAAQRADGATLAPLIDELDYERGKRALLAAREAGDRVKATGLAANLTPRFIARGDVDMLAMAGWDAYGQKDSAEAMRYWRLALDQQPQREDARYGLALALRRGGDFDGARSLLGADPETPRLRKLLGAILLEQGWESLKLGDTSRALGLSSEAKRWLRDTNEADTLRAWALYRRGEYAEAADTFAALYHKQPSRPYADGWMLSLAAHAPERLHTLPNADREPLKSALAQRKAAELYARKHFLAARQAAAEDFPQLEHIDGLHVGGGFLLRHRSGQSGLGRLTIMERPVAEGGWVWNGTDRFTIKASALALDSGKPSECAAFGSKAQGCEPFARQPHAVIDDAALVELSWARDGWFSPYAALGTTPLNGPVSPVPTYRLGLIHETAWGRWQAEAFGQPVRESLLAYAGQRNPYSGQEWGRVVKHGGRLSAYTRLGDRWGLSTEAIGSYLTGRRVADNWMAGASASVGYDFKLPGFDYFSLGPSLAFQHYDRNLNHYTLGHGGYFSPDHVLNAGLGLSFLTQESRRAIAKGRLTLGYQDFYAPAESFFPEGTPPGQNPGRYGADRHAGIFFDFELKGAWLITPNWILAGGAAARQTSGYEDYGVGLMLRYMPEARKAAFSTDIPDSFFQAVY